MSNTWTIAAKELVDMRRDRLFVVLVAFLAIATVISVGVASADFRAQFVAYDDYVRQLAASGGTTAPAAPQLVSLQLLRGGIEYLEILGALFAIVLGYGSVAKEKQRGTIQLFLSRPVGRFSFAAGKVLGLSIIWLSIVIALSIVSILAILLIGSAPITADDVVRLVILATISWLYLVFWSALTVGLTAMTPKLSTGLIVAIVIWLAFVLIIPQIGERAAVR